MNPYDDIEDFDYFGDSELDEELAATGATFEPYKNLEKDAKVNQDFSSILNPDSSRNKWFDKEYTSRYSNNPAVQDFLRSKADLLQRRGDYIQSEAEKGNLNPYVKHVNWVKRQGFFPKDAQSAYDAGTQFLKQYQLEDLESNSPSQELNSGEVGGLFEHDAFSHAFPEKYIGKVDKTLPNSVSAADEARAGMFDEALNIGFGQNPLLPKGFKKALPTSNATKQTVKLLTPSSLMNSGTDFQGDIGLEAQHFAEKYIKQADEEGYRNPYGTKLDPAIDPLVGQKMGNLSINQQFGQAAEKRYPSTSPQDASKFLNKVVIPYARDVDAASNLQLYNRAKRGLDTFTENMATSPEYKTLYDNTYFASDPIGVAIRGGNELVRRNKTGAALGASTALLNPEVAKAVEKDQYGSAASTVARDVVGGALTEAGIKAAAPTAARYVPGLVRAATPLARFAGPVATGAALFSQGQTGSLTDVVTRKAANVVPGLKSDPKTDVGRRAGNEFLYMLNQFRRGRIPYTGK